MKSKKPFKIPVKKRIENKSPLEESFYKLSQEKQLLLKRQYQVGNFYLDFAYFDNKSVNPRFKIAIEIDGEKYHSYLYQRENDYQRQIYLLMHDWYVIRFTGRQIYKNQNKCFLQLIKYIEHLENKYDQKRIIIHEN